MSVADHVTIGESKPVAEGSRASDITCSKCGSTTRLLMPIAASDLVVITGALLELHRHDGSEEDDE